MYKWIFLFKFYHFYNILSNKIRFYLYNDKKFSAKFKKHPTTNFLVISMTNIRAAIRDTLAIGALALSIAAPAAYIISAATPEISEYVFSVDYINDSAEENYIIIENKLFLIGKDRKLEQVKDEELHYAFEQVFMYDILGSPSWTAQGLSLRPEYSGKELGLIAETSYMELKDFTVNILLK